MTYYELVTYLETLIDKPDILDSDIEYINSKEISLPDSRYVRFIGQLNYVMTERLYNFRDSIEDKIEMSYMSTDDLILSMDPLKKEIEYLYKLLNIKYVQTLNHNEFIKSIIECNNALLDRLKRYFDDDERLSIIDNYYMEEK